MNVHVNSNLLMISKNWYYLKYPAAGEWISKLGTSIEWNTPQR